MSYFAKEEVLVERPRRFAVPHKHQGKYCVKMYIQFFDGWLHMKSILIGNDPSRLSFSIWTSLFTSKWSTQLANWRVEQALGCNKFFKLDLQKGRVLLGAGLGWNNFFTVTSYLLILNNYYICNTNIVAKETKELALTSKNSTVLVSIIISMSLTINLLPITLAAWRIIYKTNWS